MKALLCDFFFEKPPGETKCANYVHANFPQVYREMRILRGAENFSLGARKFFRSEKRVKPPPENGTLISPA